MRSTVLIWVFAIAVCAVGLSVAGSRYYAARSRWESTHARLIEARASRLRLASLRATLPAMIARERGDVVVLGSVAGRQVYPGGNVYCAS